jgi:hypothetical protein
MKPRVEDDKRLKLRSFRMNDEDWNMLEAHFREMVIVEHLK